MKKNYNYNELVRFYNRSLKKLKSFIALGKNPYKQDILKRRIERLYQLLTGMQAKLKYSTVSAAVAAGFVLFQPNAAKAQTFLAPVSNPYGLTATPANWSTPWFVDLDGDGDKDVMAGSTAGDFYYYKNTGTPSAPSYSALVTNPFGLANTGQKYSQPAFGDIDNDGDLDLLSGAVDGNFYFFENTGTATAPAFGAVQFNPFTLAGISDPYGYSAASFVDVDNDGDLDIMSGSYYGDFYFYENIGTASSPLFAVSQTNYFGLAGTGSNYSTATFADVDGDGDKDMFSSNGGSFEYYQNTGTASAPAFGASTTNPFLLTAITGSLNGASASFADLDNDGDLDLISGSSNPGDLFYYQNSSPLGINTIEQVAGVSLYPNPTSSNVTLKINNTSEALNVQVSNVLGQVVSKSVINNSTNVIELPEAKGMYFVKVTTAAEDKTSIFKVTKN